jgi:Outer membrane protein beta-barrel domain
MSRTVVMSVIAALVMIGNAFGQEVGGGAGRIEVGAFPGGGIFFTQSSKGNEPDFANYALAASFTVNVNRWIGIEGEGGGSLGIHQNFKVGSLAFADQRTPSMWVYSGNLVVNAGGNNRSVVPYVTGGLGGLTLCPCGEAENLGITNYETYFTGNVGGGVKWFSTRHFGVRGDYRFFMVRNRDNAPLFFGNENRFGHRLQAGLVFTY